METSNILFTKFKEYCSAGNYVDFVLTPYDESYDYDIKEKDFLRILTHLKNTDLQCFQKHYKEMVYHDLSYEVLTQTNSINVVKKISKGIDTNWVDDMVVTVWHKTKVPFHMFPSTTDISSICFVSKAIFKVSNRVFINFEIKKYQDNPTISFSKIFINYNHDENVDCSKSYEHVEKALRYLNLQVGA